MSEIPEEARMCGNETDQDLSMQPPSANGHYRNWPDEELREEYLLGDHRAYLELKRRTSKHLLNKTNGKKISQISDIAVRQSVYAEFTTRDLLCFVWIENEKIAHVQYDPNKASSKLSERNTAVRVLFDRLNAKIYRQMNGRCFLWNRLDKTEECVEEFWQQVILRPGGLRGRVVGASAEEVDHLLSRRSDFVWKQCFLMRSPHERAETVTPELEDREQVHGTLESKLAEAQWDATVQMLANNPVDKRLPILLKAYGVQIDHIALLTGVNANTIRTRIYTLINDLNPLIKSIKLEDVDASPSSVQERWLDTPDDPCVLTVKQSVAADRERLQARLLPLEAVLKSYTGEDLELLIILMSAIRLGGSPQVAESDQLDFSEVEHALRQRPWNWRILLGAAVLTKKHLSIHAVADILTKMRTRSPEPLAEADDIIPTAADLARIEHLREAVLSAKISSKRKNQWAAQIMQDASSRTRELALLSGFPLDQWNLLAALHALPDESLEAALLWDLIRMPLDMICRCTGTCLLYTSDAADE